MIKYFYNFVRKKIERAKEEVLTMKGRYEFVLEDVKTGEKEIHIVENLIPTVGLLAFIEQITEDNTEDLNIKYLTLGNGTDTPTLGDTTLINETERILIGQRQSAGNIATLVVFFNTTEANGTHKEVGVFGDGSALVASAAADSGIMYSRSLVNITKTDAKTLTITYTFTIN